MSTIAERVAAGAAFLDEHDPDWWRADVERAIDLEKLNLSHGDACVLGQRCPLAVPGDISEFEAYGYELSKTFSWRSLSNWAAPLGFQIYGPWREDGTTEGRRLSEEMDEYRELTAEWKRVIEQRRAAA
ncbi:MAG TPA: hypothetical protein VL551_16965 [Actinospica sp.]|jgi:hypothetical protein|nr:hypothetical protein [Actinospica sp.]